MEIFQINDVTNEEIRNSKSELLKQHSAATGNISTFTFYPKNGKWTVIFHLTRCQ